jgi:hypothetical protein
MTSRLIRAWCGYVNLVREHRAGKLQLFAPARRISARGEKTRATNLACYGTKVRGRRGYRLTDVLTWVFNGPPFGSVFAKMLLEPEIVGLLIILPTGDEATLSSHQV